MTDTTKLFNILEKYQMVVDELMLHVSEPNCRCTVKQFLENLELEKECRNEKNSMNLPDPHRISRNHLGRDCYNR